MADDETLAGTPGEETIVDDGIIDLDASSTEEVTTGDEPEEKPEGEGDEPKSEGEDDGDKPKKLSGSARAKIREARLQSELNERNREIEELRRTSTAATAGETADKAPREEDFNGDYFAWQRALTAHEAGNAVKRALDESQSKREETERTTKQAEIARERDIDHAERVEDAREVIADFDKVMATMKGVNIRNDVIEEIKSSDKSALLAYHLAKNPDKLNAMNAMTPRELAREMGRLEATVQLPEAKKATTAPAPLSRPKGGASPSSAESDLAAWMKRKYG